MSSLTKRPNGMWRARYRDANGKEHSRHFKYKTKTKSASGEQSAQEWLDSVTSSLVMGTYLDPKKAKTTVSQWCQIWLVGYSNNRLSTVRQARSDLQHVIRDFGSRELSSVRPSEVKAWTVKLKASGLADSTVYKLHARFYQLFNDAAQDGLIPRSPAGKKTAPKVGTQRAYVATTEQVWALHDAMPEGMRPVILLGAFAGLRVAEIAALRLTDVDFMRGIITPAIQYPGLPLKTAMSMTPIPIPQDLALDLSRVPAKWGSPTLVVGAFGRPVGPYTIQTAFRVARLAVEGLPEEFRIHDLRHYFASLLISSGLDVKVVQNRMRHTSAKTTLDVYGHMWPDKDESARAAVNDVLSARADSLRTRPATSA
jgi:integrase